HRDRATGTVRFDARDLGAELEHHALFGQYALKLLRHLAVETGSDTIQHLDHRHFRAEPEPDRAELEPDVAGADYQQPLRHRGELQRTGRRNDPLLVDLDPGDAPDFGARGNDDVRRLDRLLLAIDEGDFDFSWSEDSSRPVKMVDLVLSQQEGDA